MYGSDFLRHDSGAGSHGYRDTPRGVGHIAPITAADGRAGGVSQQKRHTAQRFSRSGNQFPDDDNLRRRVEKFQCLGFIWIDFYRLRPIVRVDVIALNALQFRRYHGPDDAVDADLAATRGIVDALAAEMAVGIVHIAPVGVGQLEFHTVQGRLALILRVFFDD